MIEILGELDKVVYKPGVNTWKGWVCAFAVFILIIINIFNDSDRYLSFLSGIVACICLCASIFCFRYVNEIHYTNYLALIDENTKYQELVENYEIVENICGNYYEIKLKENK